MGFFWCLVAQSDSVVVYNTTTTIFARLWKEDFRQQLIHSKYSCIAGRSSRSPIHFEGSSIVILAAVNICRKRLFDSSNV